MIVAGEASGDLHGAEVIRSIRRLNPQIRCLAMGSTRMREAGAEMIIDSAELSVVGITEVLGKAGRILRAYSRLKEIIKKRDPTLIILIDFPDFNIHLAKAANRAGVPVLYYISPQVWAWRPGRVKKIARRVKRMAVIFPFEIPIYTKAGLSAEFVGHPLLDIMAQREESVSTDSSPRQGCGQKSERESGPLIALLPGSRQKEVCSLLPEMVKAAAIIHERKPGARFVLPVASTLKKADIEGRLGSPAVPISVVERKTYEAVAASDLAIVASGTATLETAILGKPMVIVYKVSPLSYWVARALIKVDRVGLVNIVAGKSIVPELLQGEGRGERIAGEALRILDDPAYRERMISEIGRVREKLGTPGAAQRVARIALDMIMERERAMTGGSAPS